MARNIKEGLSHLRILISSTEPGCGLTTVSTILANHLHLDQFITSNIRRSIAEHYVDWVDQHGGQETQEVWNSFEELYANGESSAVQYIAPYLHRTYDELTLQKLNNAQKMFGQREHDQMWVKLPDILTYNALESHGILTGKLPVVIDLIVDEIPSSANYIVERVLLTVDPFEGAYRILQRQVWTDKELSPNSDQELLERIESTKARNQKRMDADWEFYKSLTNRVTGQPLQKSDLYERDDVLNVDTTNITAVQAAEIVIAHIREKVQTIAETDSPLAQYAIDILAKLDEIEETQGPPHKPKPTIHR